MDDKEEAIKFFTEQVRQFEIMMDGRNMSPPYRIYIEKLKRYYELSIEAIQRDLK